MSLFLGLCNFFLKQTNRPIRNFGRNANQQQKENLMCIQVPMQMHGQQNAIRRNEKEKVLVGKQSINKKEQRIKGT